MSDIMKKALAAMLMTVSLTLSAGASAQSDERVDVSSPAAFDRSVAQMGSALSVSDKRDFALALTAVSLSNTEALAENVRTMMDNGATEAEIDAARTELFRNAFAPIDGMNADQVIAEGRQIAQENDMTLEDMAAMLDSQILQE